ncbi:PAS domain-containing protein [Paludibacterium denitrificans]|uniref:PAS domain-containing protein n=1 Tax=Paludibacterium denitrificans TaxID=2675226 RepID=UPI001E34528E|nr:PAS domain S-box protein [Paludibacterium denitrificans]
MNRQRQQLEDSNRSLRQQINERLHSEQALAESEALLRAALQASSDAIVLTDQHGKILRANPATARLAGQPAQSLEQLPLGVLLPDFYRLPGEQPFAQMADQHEGTPFETELTRSDQHPLPVELTLNHVVMPNDCFYVAVCRDISLRKQQEAALINLKNSLTEQVEMQSEAAVGAAGSQPAGHGVHCRSHHQAGEPGVSGAVRAARGRRDRRRHPAVL